MSRNASKQWLVAYDIREPRRLGRIYRHLHKRGFAMQYSLFVIEGDDAMLDVLMRDLQALMDVRHDDIRAYHVPARCTLWRYGAQALPEGVELYARLVTHLLRQRPPETDPNLPLLFA